MAAPKLGYTLAAEEHRPLELVRYGQLAEEVGFDFAMVSDHYHPWTDRQGNSPFAWSVIAGLATVTARIAIGTAVTCPTVRIHPAIVAQAAATSAAMLPGRFLLGVGSGENLNEHILGDRWPPASVRLEMLEEAVEVIRKLWAGGQVEHHGRHYTVENARLYTLPEQPPPILAAGAGPKAVALAGRIGDGFMGTAPQRELIERYDRAGGAGKPRYGQVTVCWAASEPEARRTAHAWWPNAAIPGELGQVLPQPAHFEQAAKLVSEDDVAEVVACGPDPDLHLEFLGRFAQAGYDHLFVHQVGPDQEGYLRWAQRELLPRIDALDSG